MADEPTLGEVMRQVRALVDQVRDLVREVRTDYVRTDLYNARHNAVNQRVDELSKDLDEIKREASDREKARVAFQRQIVGGVLVGLVLMLVQLVVTALMFTGGLR